MNQLELLEYVDKLFDVDLSDCLVIACQHLLGSQELMFKKFIEKGLKPTNLFILGKCYSSSKVVIDRLKSGGVYIHPGSLRFDSHKSFDEQFDDNVKDLIEYVKSKKQLKNFIKIILLDDGGYLIYWANSLLSDYKNIVSVEQTSSGYHKLKSFDCKFSIINVARSKAKLVVESPVISKAIIVTMDKSLKKLNLEPRDVLIIGMGAIGTQLYSDLKEKYNISSYDRTFNNHIAPKNPDKFDMIIGCTGESVIDEYSKLKKDVILVSASSSDREFSAFKIRKMTKKNRVIHKDYHVQNIYLLNSGFPVCFTGSVHSSPPREIQLTIALLFSGVCQGLIKKYPKGFINLDEKIQENIIKEYYRIINFHKPYKS